MTCSPVYPIAQPLSVRNIQLGTNFNQNKKGIRTGRPDASQGRKCANCSEAHPHLFSCVVHSAAVSHLDSEALFSEVRAAEASAHLKAASEVPDAQQAAVSVDAERAGCVAALQVAAIRVDCLVPTEGDSLAR